MKSVIHIPEMNKYSKIHLSKKVLVHVLGSCLSRIPVNKK